MVIVSAVTGVSRYETKLLYARYVYLHMARHGVATHFLREEKLTAIAVDFKCRRRAAARFGIDAVVACELAEVPADIILQEAVGVGPDALSVERVLYRQR